MTGPGSQPSRAIAPRRALATLLAASLLFASQVAWAGRLHPHAEQALATLPPGGTLAVIVELADQADPTAAAAPHRGRRARARAVRDALQGTVTRTQGPIRALLASERARGRVGRVVPLWIFNGIAVTATEPVLRALAARPDVREIRPDRAIPRPAPIPPAAFPAPPRPRAPLSR